MSSATGDLPAIALPVNPDPSEALLASLVGFFRVDAQLVAAELRPLLRSLAARLRTCDACRKLYIQKRHHARTRNFCGRSCFKVAHRS